MGTATRQPSPSNRDNHSVPSLGSSAEHEEVSEQLVLKMQQRGSPHWVSLAHCHQPAQCWDVGALS